MLVTFDISEHMKEALAWIDNLIINYPDQIGTKDTYDGLNQIISKYKVSENNIISVTLPSYVFESMYWELIKWIDISGGIAWMNCNNSIINLPEIDSYKLNNLAEEMVLVL